MDALHWIVGLCNLACAALCAGLAVPLIRRRVGPNLWYGARLPRAFESDELWYDINEYGGRRLLFWSVPVGLSGLAALVLPVAEPWLVAFAFVPLLYVVGAFETWRYSRRI